MLDCLAVLHAGHAWIKMSVLQLRQWDRYCHKMLLFCINWPYVRTQILHMDITTLWELLRCENNYAARITTLWGLLHCKDYYAARITTLQGLLRCKDYYAARITTLWGLLRCEDYYAVRITTLRELLRCKDYYAARITTSCVISVRGLQEMVL